MGLFGKIRAWWHRYRCPTEGPVWTEEEVRDIMEWLYGDD
jgi:hypothetical protein